MDRLWTPWRYQYITGEARQADSHPACVFCEMINSPTDESNYVVHRARYNLIILNIYPYTTGHLLVVPYEHTAELDAASVETTSELMELTKRCQTALRGIYRPDGINLGMNLGRAAGAGVADHIHMHVLPRWSGDANFMTSVGETRVLPEDLETTYDKLRAYF